MLIRPSELAHAVIGCAIDVHRELERRARAASNASAHVLETAGFARRARAEFNVPMLKDGIRRVVR